MKGYCVSRILHPHTQESGHPSPPLLITLASLLFVLGAFTGFAVSNSWQGAEPATHATELAASGAAVSQAARDERPLHARAIESADNPGMFFIEHNWAKPSGASRRP